MAAFNSGDPTLLDRIYESDGVFVTVAGEPVAGADRIRANAEFQALGLPISVTVRDAFVAGDIALLICDWTISGVGPDGEQIEMAGTATDVARRGTDGFWRYVIDNPFGTAPRP